MIKAIKNNISAFTAFIYCIMFICLSCSNEIPYGRTVIKHPIFISLNWNKLIPGGGTPDSICFLFYSTTGKDVYKFSTHTSELHESLPSGTYQALVFNYNVQTLEFRNMNKYETAEVALINQTKAEHIMPEPDLLYGINIDNFIVGENQNTHEISPKKLVQNISFKISIDKIPDIKSCNGSISGVSSALNLSKSIPVPLSPCCTTPITTTYTNGEIVGNVFILGIQPKDENQPEVQNIVTLNFTLQNGTTLTAETDLTQQLQQIEDKDADITIETHVDPKGNVILKASISVWEEGGNTNVEIH